MINLIGVLSESHSAPLEQRYINYVAIQLKRPAYLGFGDLLGGKVDVFYLNISYNL